MSTYSLEDFYLQQVHENIKKNKINFSSWEREQEKASTWLCYIYNDTQFLGKLIFTFTPNFDKSRLIPLIVNIDFDTQSKREDVEPWYETRINNNYKYSCSYDLNKKDSLNKICQLINIIIYLPKKSILEFFKI